VYDSKEENFGKNTKRERAKSGFEEEMKTVLEVENKIVVMSSYILTSASSGRGECGINFKHRARNRPAAEAGVTF